MLNVIKMGEELELKIDLAIELLDDHKALLTYDKIIDLFKVNGINQGLADQIYIFLPIVFCKKLLPQINYPNSYLEQDNLGNKKRKFFKDNKLYRIIELASTNYFENNPDGEIVLKIASLSAEFNAINEILMGGGKLEDIKLTETIVLK